MKLSTSVIVLTALSSNAKALEFTFDAPCCYDNVSAGAEAVGKDINDILDTRNEDRARRIVEQLCASADLPFAEITGKGWQFDSNYYDGGTYLNEEYEPEDIPDFIEEVYNKDAQSKLITYPEDHIEKNFGNCLAQTVMCCWVQDRQAGDNNGNCADNDCKDADPADNTDICFVDLDNAPGSNHVEGGFALFADDSEGDAHCHGFAWSNDEDSTSYRYRGNTLFYVSMYDHLSDRGYVREVPGAPMCACIEQMPVVSRSDCTQMDITEQYTFSFDSEAKITNTATIAYKACTNNNLRNRFDELTAAGLTTDEAQGVFNRRIVEDCDNVEDQLLEDKGFRFKTD